MVKKTIYIILLYLSVINILCCAKDKNKQVYKINKNILLINNEIKIDLNGQVEEILKLLGNKYSEDFIPGYKEYYITNYSLSFIVNNDTKKIDSIFLKFYDPDKNGEEKNIDEIIIEDFIIKNNTTFEEMKKDLKKRNIEYDLDSEHREDYDFGIKNNKILSIRYMKNNIKGPWAVEIEIN